MPFRLTRNLQRVLGPLHLMGTFTAAISSAAQCFREQEEFLKSYLSLFIRDDLVSWYTGKVRNKGTGVTVQDANAERLKSALPHLIRDNVATVIDKVCVSSSSVLVHYRRGRCQSAHYIWDPAVCSQHSPTCLSMDAGASIGSHGGRVRRAATCRKSGQRHCRKFSFETLGVHVVRPSAVPIVRFWRYPRPVLQQ